MENKVPILCRDDVDAFFFGVEDAKQMMGGLPQ